MLKELALLFVNDAGSFTKDVRVSRLKGSDGKSWLLLDSDTMVLSLSSSSLQESSIETALLWLVFIFPTDSDDSVRFAFGVDGEGEPDASTMTGAIAAKEEEAEAEIDLESLGDLLLPLSESESISLAQSCKLDDLEDIERKDYAEIELQ